MAEDELPSQEELAELPLRALVAYAARCARRVQPLWAEYTGSDYDLHDLHINSLIDLAELRSSGQARGISKHGPSAAAAVEAAVEAANAIYQEAKATDPSPGHPRVRSPAHAAVRAVINKVASALLAASSAQSAVDAAVATKSTRAVSAASRAALLALDAVKRAVNSRVIDDSAAEVLTASACRSDYNLVMSLVLGEPNKVGLPVDPSEDGPLGSLWPEVEPGWYQELIAKWMRRQRKSPPTETETPDAQSPDNPHLVLIVTIPEAVDNNEAAVAIANVILAMSRYHIGCGGNGLVLDEGGMETYVRADTPAGVR